MRLLDQIKYERGKNVAEVKLLGAMYDVRLCVDLGVAGDEQIAGCTHPRLAVVFLQDDQSYHKRCNTLFHELMHQICFELAIDLDEDDIQRLGTALHDLIASNDVYAVMDSLVHEVGPDDND